MKYLIPYIITLVLFVISCDSATKEQSAKTSVEEDLGMIATDKEAFFAAVSQEDETTISVPIHEYAISISREKNEINQAKLSDQNVKELEYWWDSLPQPLQSEIKANKVDIEVVSEITTTNEKSINPDLNDSQVENTGETLEQIIGSNTGMKYTVSTTLIDDTQTNEMDEHKTNIRLVKQMPVKLNSFTADIFLRTKEVSNENIRTLQYWWTNLPEEIQEKVKNRELVLDLACNTIDGGMDLADNEKLTTNAEENVLVLADVLDRLVGVYRVGGQEISMAKISTKIAVEKATTANAKYPAKQYIQINLRNNRNFIPAI